MESDDYLKLRFKYANELTAGTPGLSHDDWVLQANVITDFVTKAMSPQPEDK